jgi:hypothetical protein
MQTTNEQDDLPLNCKGIPPPTTSLTGRSPGCGGILRSCRTYHSAGTLKADFIRKDMQGALLFLTFAILNPARNEHPVGHRCFAVTTAGAISIDSDKSR